ncbi:DEAD/DEAH box helicase [Miltoncostaea oceani]|uniref:DEAD/DEAH box helicase n=1 Tax=Miltoncostaea oceani TaxID=2843216 RepID=UPI001C3CAFC9|nr:DEAD/DEAH box helicase [Miltoncostaea oceani]
MTRSIRLRRWQKAALDTFRERPGPDFLAVATPGAGKTTFALAAARQDLALAPRRRLIVVAPTQHLKTQWADAAEGLDLHLEPSWTASDGGLPADVHGMVTSYQQVASSAAAIAAIARDAFVVLDEAHHSGEERAWGDGTRAAFAGAAVRLSLSGTPFRSDTRAIPFVRYDDDGLAQADVEYGYADALADGGVVRTVRFPRTDGEMEWVAADGTLASATFADRLDAVGSAQRLRTALSVGGEWLPDVLSRAHERLMLTRRTHPGAGGMVIAIDQEHARGIADIMRRRLGVHPVVAVSEDPGATRRIAAFATGTDPWIVAVRMISEGVDIPRLRVGVFATTTTTELFFRQAVGRLVRWTRGLGAQPSHMFIPDDPRLRAHAAAIAEQRRHSLRRPDGEEGEVEPADEIEEVAPPEREDQMSLFAAISAVATGSAPDADAGVGAPPPVATEPLDEGLLLELAPAPLLVAPAEPATEEERGLPVRERRRRLRDSNASLVRHISRITGLSHSQVNAELNRRVGVERVGEATMEQLERRRAHAARWLAAA